LAVPEPALLAPVFVPYEVLVPYSKYQDVDAPLGLTVPASVAEVGPMPVTGPVIAVGAAAARPIVANPMSASLCVVPPFVVPKEPRRDATNRP
jgi:hypothetical protein